MDDQEYESGPDKRLVRGDDLLSKVFKSVMDFTVFEPNEVTFRLLDISLGIVRETYASDASKHSVYTLLIKMGEQMAIHAREKKREALHSIIAASKVLGDVKSLNQASSELAAMPPSQKVQKGWFVREMTPTERQILLSILSS
jgi:hypothetical protein